MVQLPPPEAKALPVSQRWTCHWISGKVYNALEEYQLVVLSDLILLIFVLKDNHGNHHGTIRPTLKV